MRKLTLGFRLDEKGGKGGSTNLCMTESTDGTWYGYDSSIPMGSADPAYTTDGTFTYAIKWTADGTILMSYGVAGDEKLGVTTEDPAGIGAILVSYENSGILLTFDEATKDYRTVNTEMTDYLIADFEEGKQRCFKATVRPDLLLHYDFSEILTGSR